MANKPGIKPSIFEQHKNCDCYVERHYVQRKGKLKSLNNALVEEGHTSPKPALMCKTHGKWIKWLSERDARMIESLS